MPDRPTPGFLMHVKAANSCTTILHAQAKTLCGAMLIIAVIEGDAPLCLCDCRTGRPESLEQILMQIQINTDKNIVGDDALTRQIEATIEQVLRRFGDQITRIEAHLSDENSATKSSTADKRCAEDGPCT